MILYLSQGALFSGDLYIIDDQIFEKIYENVNRVYYDEKDSVYFMTIDYYNEFGVYNVNTKELNFLSAEMDGIIPSKDGDILEVVSGQYNYTLEKENIILNDDEENVDDYLVLTDVYCSLKYDQCTSDDVVAGNIISVESSKKDINKEIQKIVDYIYLTDVYLVDGTKIFENVGINECYYDDIMVYSGYKIDETVNISEFGSVIDFNKYLDTKKIIEYYYEGKTNQINLSGEVQTILTLGDYIYILTSDDELYGYNYKTLELEKISENIIYVFILNDYVVAVMENEALSYDSMILLKNDLENRFSYTNVTSANILFNNLYIFSNCSDDVCDYVQVNGNLKLVDTYKVHLLTENYGYVYNNYDEINNTYDLYLYDNGDLIEISKQVVNTSLDKLNLSNGLIFK